MWQQLQLSPRDSVSDPVSELVSDPVPDPNATVAPVKDDIESVTCEHGEDCNCGIEDSLNSVATCEHDKDCECIMADTLNIAEELNSVEVPIIKSDNFDIEGCLTFKETLLEWMKYHGTNDRQERIFLKRAVPLSLRIENKKDVIAFIDSVSFPKEDLNEETLQFYDLHIENASDIDVSINGKPCKLFVDDTKEYIDEKFTNRKVIVLKC
jgi:hypothetical protein